MRQNKYEENLNEQISIVKQIPNDNIQNVYGI